MCPRAIRGTVGTVRGRAVPQQSRTDHPEQTFPLMALILPHQQRPKNVREDDELLRRRQCSQQCNAKVLGRT